MSRCVSAWICLHTEETSQVEKLLKLDQYWHHWGLGVCAPTPAWSDAEETRVLVMLFSAFCHLRSHTGSGHIESQLWCHLTFLLLCECSQSDTVSVGCVDLATQEMHCFRSEEQHNLTFRERINAKNADLLQIQCENEIKVEDKANNNSFLNIPKGSKE